ncbi:hypothetical protein EDD15DRAFT_2532618 [Pisolithus albus]|nr:hypothetical protein EDD15DRAFT_2532618 [Pisolithus albus]
MLPCHCPQQLAVGLRRVSLVVSSNSGMSYHSLSHRSDGLSLVVEEEGLGEEYVVPGSFPWSSSPAPSLVSSSLTSSSSHTLPPAPPTLSIGSSGTVSLAADGPSLATLRDSLLEQTEQVNVLSDSQATTNRMLDRIRHGGEVPQDITEIHEHLHTIETRLEMTPCSHISHNI